MNIWFFNHYAYPEDLPGSTRHYDLGRELVRRGHRVVIFASSFHHNLHREMRLAPGEQWKIEDMNGVQFLWILTPSYSRNDWRRIRNMLVFMLRSWHLGRNLPRLVPEMGKPNLVIGSSVHLFAVLAAYWVAKHYQARFIMEVRDLWPQAIIDIGKLSKRGLITRILQILERFLYKRSERIIILGPQMREYICAYGVSPHKIVWIPNGVDISRFKAAGEREDSGKDFVVMYLGAHSPSKELNVLVKVAKILQDRHLDAIKFVLIGDGPSKASLMAMAQEWGLRNMIFSPSIPKTEVPRVLSQASAFIISEEGNFFSYGGSILKLSEYMVAGRPIVFAVNASNNPVEEAGCGITVSNRNPRALAEAIIALYCLSPEERQRMGANGQAYVEKHYNIEVLGQRLAEMVDSVVGTL